MSLLKIVDVLGLYGHFSLERHKQCEINGLNSEIQKLCLPVLEEPFIGLLKFARLETGLQNKHFRMVKS